MRRNRLLRSDSVKPTVPEYISSSSEEEEENASAPALEETSQDPCAKHIPSEKGKAPVKESADPTGNKPVQVLVADTSVNNPKLAKTILQSTILRKDWEMTIK